MHLHSNNVINLAHQRAYPPLSQCKDRHVFALHARPVGSFQDFVSNYQIHRKPADAESEDFQAEL